MSRTSAGGGATFRNRHQSYAQALRSCGAECEATRRWTRGQGRADTTMVLDRRGRIFGGVRRGSRPKPICARHAKRYGWRGDVRDCRVLGNDLRIADIRGGTQ